MTQFGENLNEAQKEFIAGAGFGDLLSRDSSSRIVATKIESLLNRSENGHITPLASVILAAGVIGLAAVVAYSNAEASGNNLPNHSFVIDSDNSHYAQHTAAGVMNEQVGVGLSNVNSQLDKAFDASDAKDSSCSWETPAARGEKPVRGSDGNYDFWQIAKLISVDNPNSTGTTDKCILVNAAKPGEQGYVSGLDTGSQMPRPVSGYYFVREEQLGGGVSEYDYRPVGGQ